MILVVSHSRDEHTAGVLAALHRIRHRAVLLDTAFFPNDASVIQRLNNCGQEFEFISDGHRFNLGHCRAGWWRRPQPFALPPGLSPDVVSFVYSECHEAVAGLWAALELKWVNPPELDELAHHKPYQLAVARSVGLPIPRTLITNDPDEARQFILEMGTEKTVYKTFLATDQHWRETRVVRAEELELLERVRLAPVIFQEYVPAEADLRVTIVGEQMFAAAISAAPGGYTLDYRMDLQGARFEPAELPAETQRGLRALMQRLGLIYGAVDLRRTPDRGDIFLEVNPAGEWSFVEQRTGQPITRAVAELLANLDGSG